MAHANKLHTPTEHHYLYLCCLSACDLNYILCENTQRHWLRMFGLVYACALLCLQRSYTLSVAINCMSKPHPMPNRHFVCGPAFFKPSANAKAEIVFENEHFSKYYSAGNIKLLFACVRCLSSALHDIIRLLTCRIIICNTCVYLCCHQRAAYVLNCTTNAAHDGVLDAVRKVCSSVLSACVCVSVCSGCWRLHVAHTSMKRIMLKLINSAACIVSCTCLHIYSVGAPCTNMCARLVHTLHILQVHRTQPV